MIYKTVQNFIITCECTFLLFMVTYSHIVCAEESHSPCIVKWACDMGLHRWIRLSRSSDYGRFLRYMFGHQYNYGVDNVGEDMDGDTRCIVKERLMDNSEFYSFEQMKLFFTYNSERLYKISVERNFTQDTTAKDRMKIVMDIAGKCKKWAKIDLIWHKVSDARIIYECSSEEFEIVLEIVKTPSGITRMIFSVMNNLVREGHFDRLKANSSSFDSARDIEIEM